MRQLLQNATFITNCDSAIGKIIWFWLTFNIEPNVNYDITRGNRMSKIVEKSCKIKSIGVYLGKLLLRFWIF